MKINHTKTVDFLIRTWLQMSAHQRALPLMALSALLLAATPSRGASVIQFTVTNCTVTEGCGRLEIPIQRQNDTNAVIGVEVNTLPKTALSGTHYTDLATNLTFLAGETQKIVSVSILNNGLVEGDKSFQVRLSQPTGGATLGWKTNLPVTIWDNDTGLHFYVPALTNDINAGQAVIKVARGDDGTNRVTVDYATTNGTAKAGEDYTATAGTLAFEPGEVLKSFIVPILNDALPEPSKIFKLVLSNPMGGGISSTGSIITVTLKNSDQIVQLDRANYYVGEEAAFVEIRVVRGESGLAGAVNFTTIDGTAKTGLDYAGLTNTLQFGAGERLKLVRIPILNDGLKEDIKGFRVTLSNPTGGVVIGTPRFATVQIFDNDPGVGFITNLFSVSESAGVAKVGVVRGNDALLNAFTADYQTADGTAKAGVDYEAVSGTLHFQANETLQTIAIPLWRNSAAKGPKNFKVTLNNASEGIPLGAAATQVKILHPGGYYPLPRPIGAQAKLRREEGVNLLSWEGEGVLQHADQVTGPWEDLPMVTSPYATQPSLPMGFHRILSTRPTEVYVPSGYDGKKPLPLILALHPMSGPGGGASANWMRGYFSLASLANSRGFLVCYPEGTVHATWGTFWNGPDFGSFAGDVDDSGYLRGVIEEIQRQYAVDPKRIYVTGASNGAAMAHRLAGDHADLIAAITAISNPTNYDPQSVHLSQPVHVLLIYGDDDNYQGGYADCCGLPVVAEAPGAVRTVQNWARLNGCTDPVVEAAPSIDLTPDVVGLDTTVLRYTQCPPGGAVELWTIKDGGHVPQLSDASIARIVDWLLAHPKP